MFSESRNSVMNSSKRRKAGEFRRFLDIKNGQQDEQGERDADGQKAIQQERMDRQDHQQDGPEQPANQQDVAVLEKARQVRFA